MKIATVQVLRFFAAGLVVSAHSVDIAIASSGATPAMAPGKLGDVGAVGVDLFFVISGFIISSGLIRRPEGPSAVHFFLRRWLRVAPLYFLLSAPWILGQVREEGFDLARMAATFLFWPAMRAPLVEPYLSVGWTLCFEMLFYTTVAATLLIRRSRSRWIFPVALYIAALWLRPLIGGPVLQFLGNPIIVEFLLGVIVALVWRHQKIPRFLSASACLTISALIYIYAFFFDPTPIDALTNALSGDRTLWRVIVWGMPSALLLLGLLQLEDQLRERRGLSACVFLGDASYSIYLAHPLLLYLLLEPARSWGLPTDAVFIGGMGLSIAAGALVFVFLEAPLQAALNRLTRGGRKLEMQAGVAGTLEPHRGQA